MQITVPVGQDFVHRLNRISVEKRAYPWDSSTIDWAVPITDDFLYMPEEYSLIYGTPHWDRLDFSAKSFITRYEWTQIMRNAGVGEHMLNMGILSILYHVNQYDPTWRYLLHEVAEECQHMGMFNEWCRRNQDIKTKGVGGDRWGPFASFWVPIIARNSPLFFWICVILFELVGDEVINTKSAEGVDMVHPIVNQIREAHRLEEARHIAFAKTWIENRVPALNRVQKKLTVMFTESAISRLLSIGIPLRYSGQLSPYLSCEEFHACLRSEHRRSTTRTDLTATIKLFVKLGLVREAVAERWYQSM